MKLTTTPYWWEDRPPAPDLTPQPPEKTDLLVIGAGYTGLSAAIAAHDAGANVTIVEADQPGIGASTRNGGMFGAHPRLSLARLTKLYGQETAEGVFSEATPALNFVRDLQIRENIDCDFQQSGRIVMAWERKDFDGLKKLAEELSSTSVKAEIIEKADLGNEVGTNLYYGGILMPQHGSLQPRKFHDGLLNAALKRGVAIVGECRVNSLERVGGGYLAKTAKGEVRADKVILATNGYTDKSFPWHNRRVFPLPSYLIATEPLSPNFLSQLAPGRRMMVETRARHSYYRVSPDGTRLLFGGRAAMKPIEIHKAAARLAATMAEVWPETKDVKLTHAWTGNTGYAFNHMPEVGQIDGLHYAMGFSGSGTVMAPYLGAKAGWQAVGDPRGQTAYLGTRLRTHWLHPGGKPYFLQAADLWYQYAVDTAQNIKARL